MVSLTLEPYAVQEFREAPWKHYVICTCAIEHLGAYVLNMVGGVQMLLEHVPTLQIERARTSGGELFPYITSHDAGQTCVRFRVLCLLVEFDLLLVVYYRSDSRYASIACFASYLHVSAPD
jgi:hypothetical protein